MNGTEICNSGVGCGIEWLIRWNLGGTGLDDLTSMKDFKYAIEASLLNLYDVESFKVM
ncbi:hypothetical protein CQU01_19160 [Cerasibacillus quisquiliarum]|uniref:Uncharacterized protein n=1 Tax=Cerasibacillus quisquiliarum TaxID=227865 RepID=A0A511V182_9BACI|nr:hypothetical protein CQU01_19160 [Cerasibacillus quisquiliarum]